jgi:hypothetical protein
VAVFQIRGKYGLPDTLSGVANGSFFGSWVLSNRKHSAGNRWIGTIVHNSGDKNANKHKRRELTLQLQLTQEQDMVVRMVRRFVREEIVPLEINLDPDTDQLPEEDSSRLKAIVQDMGLFGFRRNMVGLISTW